MMTPSPSSPWYAATGHDPALLQRANTTAELDSFLSAAPRSPGRPMVVLTTLQAGPLCHAI